MKDDITSQVPLAILPVLAVYRQAALLNVTVKTV